MSNYFLILIVISVIYLIILFFCIESDEALEKCKFHIVFGVMFLLFSVLFYFADAYYFIKRLL